MKKKIEVWDLCEYKINSDKKKETLSHSLFKIFPFNSDTNDNLKLLIATESKIMAMTIQSKYNLKTHPQVGENVNYQVAIGSILVPWTFHTNHAIK